MKRIFFTLAAIALSASALLPIQATARSVREVIIYDAPPPPRHERIPSARRGYVWVPGYWNWTGRRHVWIGGHWERARAGHRYRHPEWHHRGDRWELRRGGWER